jgi:hypothetical protein
MKIAKLSSQVWVETRGEVVGPGLILCQGLFLTAPPERVSKSPAIDARQKLRD